MADITVKGKSFSTDAVTGDVYFRTDTDMNEWHTYDGTRWFTSHVYESSAKLTFSADGFSAFDGRIDDGYGIYIEGIDLTTYVATTNNGTNYWTLTVRSHGPAYTNDSNTTISAAVNTSSDAVNTFVSHDVDATVASAVPADYGQFSIYAAKTLSPGNLTALANVRYRKIRT